MIENLDKSKDKDEVRSVQDESKKELLIPKGQIIQLKDYSDSHG